MKFSTILELLERLESLNPGDRKACRNTFRDFLQAFIHDLEEDLKLKTLRSFLLLLFSPIDKSRSYLIKETRLHYLLAKVYNFSEIQKEQLSKWLVQDPQIINYSIEASLGDFGGFLEKFLISNGIRSCDNYKKSPTTIFEITDILNSLSKLSSWTTSEEKALQVDTAVGFMESLFLPHSPVACKWIARIILKSFNSISFKPEQLMRAIHPCLYGIYCQSANLERTALALNEILSCNYEIFTESGELNLSIYRRVMQTYATPKLGERIVCMESIQASSIAHVYHQIHQWGEKEFIAEHKYDGERMQIHVDAESNPIKIKIYSKTGRDSTKDRIHSHEIIKKSLLTKLDADGNPMVQNCIAEAELLVLNTDTNKFEVFGGVQDFRGKLNLQGQPNRSIFIAFFDLLALNGTNLMAYPLSQRLGRLGDIFTPNSFCMLPETQRFSIPIQKSEWTLKTFLDLKLMFLDVINNGGEGLMLKGLNSIYEAGVRDHWMKLKPDYILGNGDSHEYAIVGAGWDATQNYAKVEFADCHGMNTFFVGCITNKHDVQFHNATPNVFVCFTIQNGFSRNDLIRFTEKILPQRVAFTEPLAFSTFTLVMAKHISHKMLYVLEEPATFTIQGSSYEWKGNYWVVRHPRLIRECSLDRPWVENSTTFEEMQFFGKSAKAPSSSEIHELSHVISGLDEEYLQSGSIVKNTRPFCKIDAEASHLYFKSQEKISRGTIFALNHEQDFSIKSATSCLKLENIWLFAANVPDSSPLHRKIISSIDSLFLIAGWNCHVDNCNSIHEKIAIFILQCEADRICKQVELFIANMPKLTICTRSKPLYILDAAFLAAERAELSSRFILAEYSIF